MRARVVLFTEFGEIVSDPEDLSEELVTAFNGWSKKSHITIPVDKMPFVIEGSLVHALVVKPEEDNEDRRS